VTLLVCWSSILAAAACLLAYLGLAVIISGCQRCQTLEGCTADFAGAAGSHGCMVIKTHTLFSVTL
jgi:hypothetical protein